MTTDPLETFRVVLLINATCQADAAELINCYTGRETHVEIKSVSKSRIQV